MKLTIDTKACTKHKLSLEEVLMTLVYRQIKDPPGVFRNLKNREIIVQKEGQFYVTQHWADVLDEILADSVKEQDEERLLELAKQMRALYPQGKMVNKLGQATPYYYRCNNAEVVKKLKKFFLIFGDIPDEDILKATRRYVASFNGNYTGMRLLKYFILKDDVKPSEDGTGHVEQISDLATFLENKEEEEGVVVNTDDWTSKLI